MANMDEAIKEMERMDLEDAAEEQKLMTPIDYARARGLKPQLVYYYMRGPNAKLAPYWCECGRKCIVVEEADELFEAVRKKHLERSGGVEVKP
jgi:hypothetical protein